MIQPWVKRPLVPMALARLRERKKKQDEEID